MTVRRFFTTISRFGSRREGSKNDRELLHDPKPISADNQQTREEVWQAQGRPGYPSWKSASSSAFQKTKCAVSQSADQPTLSASAILATIASALSLGVSVKQIQTATELSIGELLTLDGDRPATLRDSLWSAILASEGNACMTFDMARTVSFSAFDGLENVIFLAPTLQVGLGVFTKHISTVVGDVETVLEETDTAYVLSERYQESVALSDRLSETGVAVLLRLISAACGKEIVPREVLFAGEQHCPTQHYERALGVRPTFSNGGETSIVFDKSQLDLRPIHSDMKRFYASLLLLEVRQDHGGAVMTRSPSFHNDITRLRSAVSNCAAQGVFSSNAVAETASMSLRSAQRLARRHNHTLKSMMDEACIDKATNIMARNTQVSTEEVATHLGYSDERSFRRAFQRCTQMTPSQFRRIMRA